MIRPWLAERTLDAAAAAQLLTHHWPTIGFAACKPCGAGWDNTAFEVRGPRGEPWIFRFPRREVAVRDMQREVEVLPQLAPLLPVPIPVPELAGTWGEPPWTFAGYRRLPGVTACTLALTDAERLELAAPLGAFVAALHTLELSPALREALPEDAFFRLDWEIAREKLEGGLSELTAARVVDLALAERLRAKADGSPVRDYDGSRPEVVCHGDLYVRHLLVSERPTVTLQGVIDWGDALRGDPALDLALAYTFLPAAGRDMFLAAYRARARLDGLTLAFAEFRALGHAVAGLRYAHDVDDRDLFRETMWALRQLGQ